MRILHDLSPRLSARTAVFPGDTPFSRERLQTFEGGAGYELSAIRASVHLGAHADASIHYHPDGVGIDERPLDRYFGICQVVRVGLERGERIMPRDIESKPIRAPRMLFATGSFPDPDHWNGDFNSLSPELIDYLASRAVKLVGIDTPSVDPADSKALESHQAIYRNDLAILEGLVLDSVPEGLYTLIALPLRLEGVDASPVRAVLAELPTGAGKVF